MQEHSHFIKSLPQLQKLYHKILLEVQDMYNHLVPLKLRQRRNIHQQYQKDFVIISVCLLGKMMGFTSERSWHSFAKANFFSGQSFPERSRYNRICRQLLWIIKFLRYQFIRRFLAQAPYTIVDSLPLPLCHSARSFRVKRLRGYADRGYCASKKEHYYGFKGSFHITNTGFIVGYVISRASTHDLSVLEELLDQSPHCIVLGDKGYVSEKVGQKLARKGIQLLAMKRANSKNPHPVELTKFIRFRRKQIETLFSNLCDVFRIDQLKPNSLIGFELAIDTILFAHSLLVLWAIQDHGEGTKWRDQIFN